MEYLRKNSEDGFAAALRIYQEGAFSRSYAILTVDEPLPTAVKQGAKITGMNDEAERVTGQALRPMDAGQTELRVLYDTTDNDNAATGCRVGANPKPVVEGCFAADNKITIEGVHGYSPDYSYKPLSENKNDRTIQSMSLASAFKQRACNSCEYYPVFDKFFRYYERPDFGT